MLRIVETEIEFWVGIRHKIPLCCILFYESAWYPSIKNKIADYVTTMSHLTNNGGVVLCPECLQKEIKQKSLLVVNH